MIEALPPVVAFRRAEVENYDAAFEESQVFVARWVAFLERERAEAPSLLDELMERSGEQREILLLNSRRFRTWGLLELAAEKGREASVRNPRHGEELGLLALRIADLLKAQSYQATLLADSRARAWACIANARRLQADLTGAEAAFKRAWGCLGRGTGDLLEKALLMDLQASLKKDRRRFVEAFRLLRRATALFFDLGERHRAGRALISLAILHYQIGEPRKAAEMTRRALQLIEPEWEPRLVLSAHHNLVVYLVSAGHFLDAQGAYRETRPLYRRFPDAWTQNRRKWVKGQIALGLGQPVEAESLFLAARDGFLTEGVPYDTALVSLDLALLYAEQGRTAELKHLAAELVPIFASRQIHREALAALSFLQKAVEAEQASVELVERVGDYLRKARYAPELSFRES
jgi:tetratricopeptide (TPR) repeat protein